MISKESWDGIQETVRLMENEYLSNKVLDGMEKVKRSEIVKRALVEVTDV